MRTTNYNKILKLSKPGYLAIALSGLLFSSGPRAFAQSNTSEKIHIGLVYPLSSNGTHAPLDTNKLSFHLLAGVSSVETGFSFAGFSNIIRNEARGTQIAMFSNHVGKKLQVCNLLDSSILPAKIRVQPLPDLPMFPEEM